MCLFLRITAAVMLILVFITLEGAAREVMFNIEDGGADNEGMESEEVKGKHITFSPSPLCAQETLKRRLGFDSGDENMEYSPSTYKEVRCKKSGEVNPTVQSCAYPPTSSFPPNGQWGEHTACLQRWENLVIFSRPAGSNGRWEIYDEREIPSGCECVIMTPLEEEEGRDVPSENHQGRFVPVALQRYIKSNRYGRSIEINI